MHLTYQIYEIKLLWLQNQMKFIHTFRVKQCKVDAYIARILRFRWSFYRDAFSTISRQTEVWIIFFYFQKRKVEKKKICRTTEIAPLCFFSLTEFNHVAHRWLLTQNKAMEITLENTALCVCADVFGAALTIFTTKPLIDVKWS